MNNIISLSKYKQKNCTHELLNFDNNNKIIDCNVCKKKFSSFGAIRYIVNKHLILSKKEKNHLNDLLYDALYKMLYENNKLTKSNNE